ncbi:hypothetical protein BC629DRAFT_1466126 [Irpex lacteus]|nr:hypothetical protein BC629DRAFT_1466126 [Irpex lacteus]
MYKRPRKQYRRPGASRGDAQAAVTAGAAVQSFATSGVKLIVNESKNAPFITAGIASTALGLSTVLAQVALTYNAVAVVALWSLDAITAQMALSTASVATKHNIKLSTSSPDQRSINSPGLRRVVEGAKVSAAGVTTCLGASAGDVASLTAAVAFSTAARVEGGSGNVGAFSRLKTCHRI